jgi:gliding motility-associated-like protein
VTLSEACGSPTTDSCLTITFPTAITPMFSPDIPTACEPGTFSFTNNSNNQSEIATVLVEFGDGEEETLTGAAGTTHTYVLPQSYTLTATVTSVYGCVTTNSFPGIVSVIAKPTADFNISSNPTTIFETTVIMQDKSSAGVVSWEWQSAGSIPTASTSQNPTFKFPEGVVATYPIMLIVETAEGCIDTVWHDLIVNSDILFFAPNAFTPDGDEFNQTWDFAVSGIDEYNFELMIFNRWGEVIWETHDVNATWDGTYNGQLVPSGTYTWSARVKDMYNDGKKTFGGSITVFPSGSR